MELLPLSEQYDSPYLSMGNAHTVATDPDGGFSISKGFNALDLYEMGGGGSDVELRRMIAIPPYDKPWSNVPLMDSRSMLSIPYVNLPEQVGTASQPIFHQTYEDWVSQSIKQQFTPEVIDRSNYYSVLSQANESSLKSYSDLNRPEYLFAKTVSVGVVDGLVGEYTGKWVGDAFKALKYSKIGSTGAVGERALKQLGGESQVYFRTSQGGRYIDQLVEDVAHESKVGYTAFTSKTRLQILKDLELLQVGKIEEVNWHFYKSPVTGKIGPTPALRDALNNANIRIFIHH